MADSIDSRKSSSLRNDSPQSIPLADLEGELKLSSLSIMSAKSLQSIKSYHGSMKVQNYISESFLVFILTHFRQYVHCSAAAAAVKPLNLEFFVTYKIFSSLAERSE